MRTRRASSDGTPIEQAPLWVLAIVVLLLWLLAFPAIVGLLHGFGLWQGGRRGPAIAGAVLALALAIGLRTRAPWRRTAPIEQRPVFVRFSSWLIGLVLYPNLMMGVLLLTRSGPPPDYWTTGMLGLLLSTTQGILAWAHRRRVNKTAAPPNADPPQLRSSHPARGGQGPRHQPAQRGVLIVNPRSGRGRHPTAVSDLTARLAARGVAVTVEITARPGHATELARQAVRDSDVGFVFALGGDGTVREVAAGMLGSRSVLVPLPGGTTDVVAGALGLGRDPRRIVDNLADLRPREIDVGLCGDRPFLMQASAGLDAYVMQRLRPRWKARLGKLEVAWSGIGAWWRYRMPEIRLVADGRTFAARGAIVANLPFYAGQFRLIPGGRDDDGRLDLLLFRGRGRAAALGFAAALALGRHSHRRDVEILPVREVRFEAPDDVPMQVDGDPFAAPLPVTISLASQRLRVLTAAPAA